MSVSIKICDWPCNAVSNETEVAEKWTEIAAFVVRSAVERAKDCNRTAIPNDEGEVPVIYMLTVQLSITCNTAWVPAASPQPEPQTDTDLQRAEADERGAWKPKP